MVSTGADPISRAITTLRRRELGGGDALIIQAAPSFGFDRASTGNLQNHQDSGGVAVVNLF